METVREYVTQGLALRAEAGIKVRQPIASIIVPVLGQFTDFTEILQDELNVKQVKTGDVLALDTKLTSELRREGIMREIVRHVQAARKAAGLNVDDRIVLSLASSDKHIKQAIEEHEATVAAETLASHVQHTPLDDSSYQTEVMLDGQSLAISLKRAS
jgi:isoleucyl-tRNA synthetase